MLEWLLKVFPALIPKERFLVVEILNKLVRASFIKINFEKKALEMVKVISQKHELTDQAQILKLVKRLLRQFGKLTRYKIIFSLDSLFATTIHASAVLARDKPKTPIDETDLDNRVAQGIWRLFDRGRGRAAQKMKVRDLDVLLTDVKVKRVKVDGHRLVNPLGFKAKTVEIQFIQTFCPGPFIAELKKIIPAGQLTMLAEAGVPETDVISRTVSVPNFLLLTLFSGQASVFLADGSSINHLATVSWGKENLIKAIAQNFAVSTSVAEEIFELYLIRQASQAVLKRIEKLLLEQFGLLFASVSKAVSKYKVELIYILAFFNLPQFVFSQGLRRQLNLRARLLPAAHELIRDQLGFDIKFRRAPNTTGMFSSLAALLEFYFSPHDDKINKIARRHARWLIS